MGKGGGGGGLRILPHKSWNVYNFDNRKKVKEDEEKHRKEEEEKERKLEAAESEFRLGVLRDRVKRRHGGSSMSSADPHEDIAGDASYAPNVVVVPDAGHHSSEPEPTKHINLFESAEHDLKQFRQKRDLEDEKRAKDMKQMKRIAPDTFFAHTALDPETGQAPWYNRALTKEEAARERTQLQVETKPSLKQAIDPLSQLNDALGRGRYGSKFERMKAESAAHQDAYRKKRSRQWHDKQEEEHARKKEKRDVALVPNEPLKQEKSNNWNVRPEQALAERLKTAGYAAPVVAFNAGPSNSEVTNVINDSAGHAISLTEEQLPVILEHISRRESSSDDVKPPKDELSAEQRLAELQTRKKEIDAEIEKLTTASGKVDGGPTDVVTSESSKEEESNDEGGPSKGSDNGASGAPGDKFHKKSKRRKRSSSPKPKKRSHSHSKSAKAERKKHKRAHKHKEHGDHDDKRKKNDEAARSSSTGETDIDRLRRERKERETQERSKTSKLFNLPTWALHDQKAVQSSGVFGSKYNNPQGYYQHITKR